jgi:hypothetical protein
MPSVPTSQSLPRNLSTFQPADHSHQAFHLNHTRNMDSMLYTSHVVGQNVELRYSRVCDFVCFSLTIAVDILLGVAERQCSLRLTAMGREARYMYVDALCLSDRSVDSTFVVFILQYWS